MGGRTAAVLGLVLFGVLGWGTAIWQHPALHGLPCPPGYVAVFRADMAPACAAYVVEPVK